MNNITDQLPYELCESFRVLYQCIKEFGEG